jgi:pimeloyl-ACP methyl ester carboxylesterase
MSTFVLLPGFWLGAWAWRPVTADLRARGHDVHPLSLTGMGERAHLAGPGTDLDTHVTDVLGLIRSEDLHDVVLVGHGYAGTVVISSVADRLPERIARLVFIDSGPLPDGMSHAEFLPPPQLAAHLAAVGEGWQLPPDPIPGVPAERLEPQPWATATTPVRLSGEWEKVPRLHVLCSFGIDQVRERVGTVPAFRHMADEGWSHRELPGSHWPMVEHPAELAQILHEETRS